MTEATPNHGRSMTRSSTRPPATCARRGAPPLDSPEYKSTQLRTQQPLIFLPQNITELTGPALGSAGTIGELDHDLTRSTR